MHWHEGGQIYFSLKWYNGYYRFLIKTINNIDVILVNLTIIRSLPRRPLATGNTVDIFMIFNICILDSLTNIPYQRVLLHGSLRVIQLQFRLKVYNIPYQRVLLHGSLRVIQLQFRFKVYNIPYQRVLLHGSLRVIQLQSRLKVYNIPYNIYFVYLNSLEVFLITEKLRIVTWMHSFPFIFFIVYIPEYK
jgi:hypothetical protein